MRCHEAAILTVEMLTGVAGAWCRKAEHLGRLTGAESASKLVRYGSARLDMQPCAAVSALRGSHRSLPIIHLSCALGQKRRLIKGLHWSLPVMVRTATLIARDGKSD